MYHKVHHKVYHKVHHKVYHKVYHTTQHEATSLSDATVRIDHRGSRTEP